MIYIPRNLFSSLKDFFVVMFTIVNFVVNILFIVYIALSVSYIVSEYRGSQQNTTSTRISSSDFLNKVFLNEFGDPITLKDIIGNEKAKKEIKSLINIINNKEQSKRFNIKLPKGYIFYGAPGVGKTMFAKAVANEARTNTFSLSASELNDKFVGVPRQKLVNLFNNARLTAKKNNNTSIILFDEIDSMFQTRNAMNHNFHHQDLVSEFLYQLDGLNNYDDVVVIGTTNTINNIDPAILRPGRLDKLIKFEAPTMGDAEELFRRKTVKYSDKLNLSPQDTIEIQKIVSPLAVYNRSLAAINECWNKAAMIALEKDHVKIDKSDFISAISDILPRQAVDEKIKWNTCYHEAGHTLACYYFKNNFFFVAGGNGGFTGFLPPKDFVDANSIIADIKICLSGRLGEMWLAKNADKLNIEYYPLNPISSTAGQDLNDAHEAIDLLLRNGGSKIYMNRAFTSKELESNSSEVSAYRKKIIDKAFLDAKKLFDSPQFGKHLQLVAEYLYDNNDIIGKDHLLKVLGYDKDFLSDSDRALITTTEEDCFSLDSDQPIKT